MISIILAGIRPERWESLYQSFIASTNGVPFEVIFVGPSKPPMSLRGLPNVVHIKDYGAPTRCHQLALLRARYKFITTSADDAIYNPNAIRDLLNVIDHNNMKSIVVCKYTEGDGPWDVHMSHDYYVINKCESYVSPYVSNDWIVFNAAILHTDYVKSIGGWDCRFEGPHFSQTDLAIRAQRNKADIIFSDISIAHCAHMPGTTGDHAPIYYAHYENDAPLYQTIYSDPSCVDRYVIDINNWQKSSDLWRRRWKDVPKGYIKMKRKALNG